jgi:hypothetical protein
MPRPHCHALSGSARRHLLPIALTWALSGAAGASEVPELELKALPELQTMLMAHVKEGTVESPMASLTLTSVIEHKANFGYALRHRIG